MTKSTGEPNQSLGIAATSPSILVLPIRLECIVTNDTPGQWDYGYDDLSIIKAIHALAKKFKHGYWAEQVRVVNMSFSSPKEKPGAVELAIQVDVQEDDRLYVASAGNDVLEAKYYPAAYSDWVLGVSGLIWDGDSASWLPSYIDDHQKLVGSNYVNDGYQTYPVSGLFEIISEGDFTTRSTSTEAENPAYGIYDNFAGTSAAAAQVSSLAALMYHNRPGRLYGLVKYHIHLYRDLASDLHGDAEIAGLVDFDAALAAWGKDPGR